MEQIIPIVLSGLSLLVSIILAICQIKTSIKLHKIESNSYYCEKIFNEYLIKLIPISRKKVQFNSKMIFVGTDELIQTLRNMLKDSLFFKYFDNVFYVKLKGALQDLENILVENTKKQVDSTEQENIYHELDKLITKIYSLINKKRISGR